MSQIRDHARDWNEQGLSLAPVSRLLWTRKKIHISPFILPFLPIPLSFILTSWWLGASPQTNPRTFAMVSRAQVPTYFGNAQLTCLKISSCSNSSLALSYIRFIVKLEADSLPLKLDGTARKRQLIFQRCHFEELAKYIRNRPRASEIINDANCAYTSEPVPCSSFDGRASRRIPVGWKHRKPSFSYLASQRSY